MIKVYKICIRRDIMLTNNHPFSVSSKILYDVDSDSEYIVYAITGNKKMVDDFLSSRNGKLFFILEEYFDNSMLDDVLSSDEYLEYRTIETKSDEYSVNKIKILLTSDEYKYILHQKDYINTLIYKGKYLANTHMGKLLCDKYIEVLYDVRYLTLYEYVFNGTVDKPILTPDEFSIVMHQNKYLF